MERCWTDPKQDNDKIFFCVIPSSSFLSLNSLLISSHPSPTPQFSNCHCSCFPSWKKKKEETCKAQIRQTQPHKGTLFPNEQKYSHLKMYIKCLWNEGDLEVIVGAAKRMLEHLWWFPLRLPFKIWRHVLAPSLEGPQLPTPGPAAHAHKSPHIYARTLWPRNPAKHGLFFIGWGACCFSLLFSFLCTCTPCLSPPPHCPCLSQQHGDVCFWISHTLFNLASSGIW